MSARSLTSRSLRRIAAFENYRDFGGFTEGLGGVNSRESPWYGWPAVAFVTLNCTGMKHMASAGKKSNASGTSTKRKSPRRQAWRFVVCINNAEYPASLDLHKIYCALPDKDAARDGDIRVIDESGEDYVYPAKWFVPVEVPPVVRSSLRRRIAT